MLHGGNLGRNGARGKPRTPTGTPTGTPKGWPRHADGRSILEPMTGDSSPRTAGTGFGNFHTHTRDCDGKGEAREFAEIALARGMPRIGFSGHNPVPFAASWTMPAGTWTATSTTCGSSRRPVTAGRRCTSAWRPITSPALSAGRPPHPGARAGLRDRLRALHRRAQRGRGMDSGRHAGGVRAGPGHLLRRGRAAPRGVLLPADRGARDTRAARHPRSLRYREEEQQARPLVQRGRALVPAGCDRGAGGRGSLGQHSRDQHGRGREKHQRLAVPFGLDPAGGPRACGSP